VEYLTQHQEPMATGSAGNKEQVESAMAELAVAQLSGRIPALFDHYVGFEVAEIEDDGARAFGLLGFAVRSLEIYVPVIYLSGRIKGTETMNLAKTGKFVSASRSWADYLIESGRSSDIGTPDTPPQGTSGSGASLDVYRSPDYAFSGFKSASINDFCQHKYPGHVVNEGLDVPRIVKLASREVQEDFLNLVASDPAIVEAMFRHYGKRALDITHSTGSVAMRKSAADLVGTAAPKEPVVDEIQVFEDVTDPAAKELSQDKKIDLTTTGIAIVDARAPESKTRVVKSTSAIRTTNPNSTGIFEVLSASSLKAVKAIIAPTPFAIERPSNPMPGTLVLGVDGSTDWFWDYKARSGNTDKNRIVVVADKTDGAADKLAKKVKTSGVNVGSAKVGSTYVLVRRDGDRMSMPFRVINKAGGRIMVKSCDLDAFHEKLNSEKTIFHRSSSHPSHTFPYQEMTNREEAAVPIKRDHGIWIDTVEASGICIVESGARLVVPSTWALLPVGPKPENLPCCEEDDNHFKGRNGIATAGEIEMASILALPNRKSAGLPGFERLLVDNDGSGRVRVRWKNKTASWRNHASAVNTLVRVVGLEEIEARSLVRHAAEDHATFDGWAEPRGIHKTAAQINIPWPEDYPQEAGSTKYSGTKVVTPNQMRVSGEFEGYHDPRSDYDPSLSNYNLISGQAGKSIGGGGVQGIVSRAAQSGMKQVFDMAVASFLMRGGRLGIQIEEDILPYLEAGLDRACRLILRFYWNNKEFSSLYGADGMSEFEDIMLSNINETGKAVLFLKRRSGTAMTSYDDLNSLSEG